MTADFQSLLPISANGWTKERAVEQVSGERWKDVDVDIIRRWADPWRCPAHLLSFLAYEYSVDIWSEDWPELKKRGVIASAVKDHRLKGTKAGLRRYLEIADAELKQVRTPRPGFRLGRAMTPEERAAWLAQYPELRIYRERKRFKLKGFVVGRSFVGGRSSHGPAFLVPDDSEAYAIPQSYLYDRGVETKLITFRRDPVTRKRVVGETLEVRIPKPLRGFVMNRSFIGGRSISGRAFLRDDDADQRVYTIVAHENQTIADSTKLAVDVARPDLNPIDVRSEFVKERYKLKGLILGKSRIGKAFMAPDRAVDHIYTRTRLFDPSRPLPKRSAGGNVIGRDRISIPPHTARARVQIEIKVPRKAFVIGRRLGGRFILPRQDQAYKLALAAIRSSKRFTDTILVETKTIDRATISHALTIGDFTIGEMREAI